MRKGPSPRPSPRTSATASALAARANLQALRGILDVLRLMEKNREGPTGMTGIMEAVFISVNNRSKAITAEVEVVNPTPSAAP